MEDLIITGRSSDKLEQLKEKGVYPYEYMNDATRFAETQLPSKEVFYSKLSITNMPRRSGASLSVGI